MEDFEPKGIHTELVGHDHTYTSVDVPWEMGDRKSLLYRTLFHRGEHGLCMTSHEAARSRRQTRFLAVFAALFCVWLYLWLF